jgi:hypothetical protein
VTDVLSNLPSRSRGRVEYPKIILARTGLEVQENMYQQPAGQAVELYNLGHGRYKTGKKKQKRSKE